MAKRILGLLPETKAFEDHLLQARRAGGQLRYTARTARSYAQVLTQLLRTRRDFLSVLSEHETTPRWNTMRSALTAWAAWKGDEQLIDRLRATTPPPINYHDTKPPTDAEWDRIFEAAMVALADPWRSALLLIVVSGLRVNEVFQLTRKQAELGITNREIAIWQKGSRVRQWAPSTQERALLRNILSATDWRILRDVFDPTKPGAVRTDKQRYDAAYNVVRRTLREVCESARVLYVRPHRYRHAVANDLVHNAKATIVDVQQALGHADSRTTDRFYLHSDAERQVDLKDRAAARRGRKLPP